MTERKPHGMSHETWIDKQIREAQDRGDFDDLPGRGRPLPGAGEVYDEHWWVKGLLRREQMPADAALPESLVLRRDVEQLPNVVARMRSERQVRDAVAHLNVRIAHYLRMPTEPFAPVTAVDADTVVARWRLLRPAAATPSPPPRRRRRWWHGS